MLGPCRVQLWPSLSREPRADPSHTYFPEGRAASWRSLLFKRREPGSTSDAQSLRQNKADYDMASAASPPSCAHFQSRRSVSITGVPKQYCLGAPVVDLIANGEKCPPKVLLSTPMLGPFRLWRITWGQGRSPLGHRFFY